MKTAQRWFPKTGDLVSVPYEGSEQMGLRGIRPRASYGVIVGRAESDFPGVWWNVFTEGRMLVLHLHVIQPLLDLQGKWLKVI